MTGLTLLNGRQTDAGLLTAIRRVDLPPVTELRTADGKLLCGVESADASEVLKERGSYPERFVAKGRDGVTDISGIVHRERTLMHRSPIR